MGFKIEVGGFEFNLLTYSVQEDSTPLAGGDTSGQVGTINLTVQVPNPDLPSKNQLFKSYGPKILQGKDVVLSDTRKGFTLGYVTSVSDPRGATFQLTCETRLGKLNIYNVQAQPFVGTLRNAFQYYASLAGITAEVYVDDTVADRSVVFPGWNGELWFQMKQMAAAIDCDISLVSGVILLRPIRAREAVGGRDVSRSLSVSGQMAQNIEVYVYQNQPVTNTLVYPIKGWSEDVPIISANAGEYVEEVIELSTSLTSIVQPQIREFVSQSSNTESVFTVSGDDGFPITETAWNRAGGKLSVEINPDTTSITVKFQAPTGEIPNRDGSAIKEFGLSLSSDENVGKYSTLRLIGSGVQFDKQLITIPTGLSKTETGTEVGITIDNPFVRSLNDAYRVGLRAAKSYAGNNVEISGEVISVNRLGDTGITTFPSYNYVQSKYNGMTYDAVDILNAGKSYQQVQADLLAEVQGDQDFDNQVFGNVNGARVWDKDSNRFYRIRSATLALGATSFEAEDDLLYNDILGKWGGVTYNAIQSKFSGLSYNEVHLIGAVDA